MTAFDFHGKRVLIIGRGLEGQSALRFLAAHYPDATLKIVDELDGSDYLDGQNAYDIAIRSPGVSPHKITIPSLSPTMLFFLTVGREKVIGITGSKGKSTTASLIHHILSCAGKRSALIGNIGKPALDVLNEDVHYDWYVYELSSYQLIDASISPHIAVVTSLFPEHMDYHGSEELYYAAKKNIVAHTENTDFFIYNQALPKLVGWAQEVGAASVPFDPLPLLETKRLPLIGSHNLDNIRAALTCSRIIGIEKQQAVEALYSFKPLPHRMSFVGTYQTISFYDDAIATTPQATIAAIRALGRIGCLILGGKDRGYDFSALAECIVQARIPVLIFFPDSGKKIHQSIMEIAEAAYKPIMLETRSMEEAVEFAYNNTPAHTICLLSCASPSYSLWKNYQEKGEAFIQQVRKER